MGVMVAMVIVLVVIVGILGAAFWSVLRSESNSGPALGTNNPYPDGMGLLGPGDDGPGSLPTPVISDAELVRRNAHRHLEDHKRATRTRTKRG